MSSLQTGIVLTIEQKRALTELSDALTTATTSGLLDALLPMCACGDSINDLCDAVTFVDRNQN